MEPTRPTYEIGVDNTALLSVALFLLHSLLSANVISVDKYSCNVDD